MVRPRPIRMRCAAQEGRVTRGAARRGPEGSSDMRHEWAYLVVPLEDAGRRKKKSADLRRSQGWEAVGLTLKKGDLIAWPVVLLKRPVGEKPPAGHARSSRRARVSVRTRETARREPRGRTLPRRLTMRSLLAFGTQDRLGGVPVALRTALHKTPVGSARRTARSRCPYDRSDGGSPHRCPDRRDHRSRPHRGGLLVLDRNESNTPRVFPRLRPERGAAPREAWSRRVHAGTGVALGRLACHPTPGAARHAARLSARRAHPAPLRIAETPNHHDARSYRLSRLPSVSKQVARPPSR